MRRVSALLIAAVLLGAAVVGARADTGTYRILDYRVTLTPHSNGKVDIAYYQKWRVSGGHIPWIAVGVANQNIGALQCGLNARAIENSASGSWSGVRLDLDRDYGPGEVFQVSFSLVQNKLFYADEKNYRLDFTPGWYDQAVTDHLELRVRYFAKPEVIKAAPQPTSQTKDELIWAKTGLAQGQRFSISVTFPKNAYPRAIPTENLQGEAYQGPPPAFVLFVVGGVIVLIIVAGLLYLSGRGGYTGGGIFYGGRRSGGGGGGGLGGIFTGGGGGFGGAGISCACACVSCACACACAGGGGAGCSRKSYHACRQCQQQAKP